ncbi:Endoplasmic reticulum, protein Pkr1 [Ophiocordyceps camponoti-floridani]|uniref:Endoplasmic reticulum, protein Pkr1 n=1 Tax=Ophiocordyceps camponoti-floridani TaxID=2030778 RepID=A0A8H4Q0X8_9HYPO|nr:Endoplasmic reticulum, protein Pkr1 [Ophiocordyceps camponoti-floridani]
MASSLATDLWDAIFTPGTTPALLRATNMSFACLQLVLGALLAATTSPHFVVLSGLCAVLWYSVNWFVAEMEAETRKMSSSPSRGDESSDTEVEESVAGSRWAGVEA